MPWCLGEEIGYVVKTLEKFLVMNEYYEEYKYVSYYFECEVIGKGQQQLAILGKHQEYAATNEEKRGIYLREYTALCECLERVGKKNK